MSNGFSLRIAEELKKINLQGKRYVVTGGTSGSGQATCAFLAQRGAEVVTTGRNLEKGEKNFSTLSQEVRERITLQFLDLQDMNSVESFAKQVLERWDSLDGLVNNAGGALMSNGHFEQNGKKYDKQFVGNHVGVFHLTNLLLPLLESSSSPRLINLTSVMHDQAQGMQKTRAQIHWDDIHCRDRKFNGFDQYAQSKLANLLHAKSLARKYTVEQLAVFPVHPGTISQGSNFDRMMPAVLRWLMAPVFFFMRSSMRPIDKEDGAQTTLHCLLSKEALEHHGMYHAQTGIKHSDGIRGGWPYCSANPLSHDEGVQDRLWKVTAAMVEELKA